MVAGSCSKANHLNCHFEPSWSQTVGNDPDGLPVHSPTLGRCPSQRSRWESKTCTLVPSNILKLTTFEKKYLGRWWLYVHVLMVVWCCFIYVLMVVCACWDLNCSPHSLSAKMLPDESGFIPLGPSPLSHSGCTTRTLKSTMIIHYQPLTSWLTVGYS